MQAVPFINVYFQGSGQPPCGAEILRKKRHFDIMTFNAGKTV